MRQGGQYGSATASAESGVGTGADMADEGEWGRGDTNVGKVGCERHRPLLKL